MAEIIFEKENSRAAAYDGKKLIGSCQLEIADGGWTVNHTEVDPAYGGQGIAKHLVQCVSDEARKENAHLTLVCSYAKKVLA